MAFCSVDFYNLFIQKYLLWAYYVPDAELQASVIEMNDVVLEPKESQPKGEVARVLTSNAPGDIMKWYMN